MYILVTGLSNGMLLFLMAAGLSLVFGLMGVVNFAHGALYMLGAYTALQFVRWTGSFWLALLFAPLVVGLVGTLMERFMLRRLYGRDPSYQLLLSFGCILIIEESIRAIWGVNFQSINPPPILMGTTQLFGSTITDYRLFIIVFGAFMSIALIAAVERTRVGMVVRAASVNSAMVSCLGIDTGRVRTAMFFAGAALAGIGGVAAAPLLPLKLGMSLSIIIDCFIVVVIGGLGNIRGAVLGALLIGMTRAVAQRYAADWIFILSYGLLIVTLVFRPEGLLNFRGRTA